MQALIKRIFDIVCSLIGIIVLFPIFILIGIAIILESKGGILFNQKRVGLYNQDFELHKFRTMYVFSEQQGQLTIGKKDARITTIGLFLRRFKLDELPQLFNVLKGEMSIVGPRPEVRKYVNFYTQEQLKVLNVKPGITDEASIKFINENELLGTSDNPEQTYIEQIMPEKLRMNLQYAQQHGFVKDLIIILNTLLKIIYIK